jgi:hypothetical protein
LLAESSVPLYLSIPMIPAGLAVCALGLWANGRVRPAVQALAVLAAPAGLLVALAGTLLVCIPDFFG